MTRTNYQQHLLDEYSSYLRKAVLQNSTKTYSFTAEQLAATLMRAFEKGVMKGVLYESMNDIERHTPMQKPQPKAQQPKEETKQQLSQEDLQKLTQAFMSLFGM